MTRRPVVVEAALQVAETISRAAAAAWPRETGGLLLGWWDTDRIVVHVAVEVPDEQATTTSWTREQDRAQTALDAALDAHEHPWLGYVGDWHSHPADCGASSQDVASIRRASRQYTEPIVLIVHRTHTHSTGGTDRTHGAVDHVVAHRGRLRTTMTVSSPRDHLARDHPRSTYR